MAILKEDILELFQEIALPFKDKEGGPKLDKIQEFLANRGLESRYIEGEGLIVNELEKPRSILVSHMDLIKRFQKGFAEGNVFEIITRKKGTTQFVQGALDNTITNAIGILVLLELIENGVTDIELFLSEGEEVGFIGMDNYLQNKLEKSKETFFVNLDVTNEGWKKDFSIEYDKPNFAIYKQVRTILNDFNSFYTGDREGDDTDAILRRGCHGFSYCLPTDDNIHSYRNTAYLDSLEPYAEGLYKLLSELNFETIEDKKSDFQGYYLKLANKAKSLKSLNKKIAKKRKNQYNYSGKESSWGDYSFKNNNVKPDNMFDRTEISNSGGNTYIDWGDPQSFNDCPFDYEAKFNKIVNEDPFADDPLVSEGEFEEVMVAFLNRYGYDNDLLLTFILERVALNEGFGLEDFINVLPTKNKTEGTDLLYLMEKEKLVEQKTPEYFSFKIN